RGARRVRCAAPRVEFVQGEADLAAAGVLLDAQHRSDDLNGAVSIGQTLLDAAADEGRARSLASSPTSIGRVPSAPLPTSVWSPRPSRRPAVMPKKNLSRCRDVDDTSVPWTLLRGPRGGHPVEQAPRRSDRRTRAD